MGIKVGVFFGGRSVEHEVSVISAIQAINAFDKNKYDIIPAYITTEGLTYVGEGIDNIEEYKDIDKMLTKMDRVVCVQEKGRLHLIKYPQKRFKNPLLAVIDVVFPIVHGTNVEDGALQGFFKSLSVPFVGSDVTASAVGMDKYVMKAVLKDNKIPVLSCKRIYVNDYYKDTDSVLNEIESAFPVIVKPVNLGSSIGIKKAAGVSELREALEYAFQYTNTAIIERSIENLKEINCAALGDADEVIASECEEPVSTEEILSYKDKYMDGSSKGMSAAKRKMPADISEEMRDRVRELAKRTFSALGCAGVARIDFMIDLDTDELWVNEINTIPGSLSFYLWEPVGVPYDQLLDKLVSLAFKRVRDNENISSSFDTNILANFSGVKGSKKFGGR